MFLRIKIGFGMADGKAPEIFSRCDERRGEPGAQLPVPLEGVPFFLCVCVAYQNALLLGQNAMEKRRLVRDKRQGSAGTRLFRLFRAGPFSKGEHMRTALGYQHPSARVRD